MWYIVKHFEKSKVCKINFPEITVTSTGKTTVHRSVITDLLAKWIFFGWILFQLVFKEILLIVNQVIFFKIWKKIKSQPKRQTLPLCHREAKVPRVRPKEQHIRVDQNGTYRVGLGKEEWETIDGYTKLWTYKPERKICKTLSQIYDDKKI